MKRAASRQITKDDGEEENEEQGGTWKKASESKIAKRTIIKAKRKRGGTAAVATKSPFPTFNFGGTDQTQSEPEAKKAPVVNAFAKLIPPGWDCTSCYVRNELSASKCKSCEEPREGAGAKSVQKEEPKKAAPVVNAFAKLIKPGWDCQSCYVRNEVSATKCKSCEVPKETSNGKTEESSEAKPAEESGTASWMPTFTFDANAASEFTQPAIAPSFTFGSTASSGTSETVPTFTFGSTFTSNSIASFGSVASTASQSESNNAFSTGSLKELSRDAKLTEEGSTNEVFKGKQAEKTNLENDTTLYKVRCRAYNMKEVSSPTGPAGEDIKASKFVEMGVGDLKVNSFTEGGQTRYRMVLHAEKTHRLCLNASIFDGMKYQIEGEKFIRFGAINPDKSIQLHLLKFKTKSDARQVCNTIDECIESLKE